MFSLKSSLSIPCKIYSIWNKYDSFPSSFWESFKLRMLSKSKFFNGELMSASINDF